MRDPINYFDQIYQAALQQDERLLPPEGTYNIDDIKQGHVNLSAAAQLAFEGKFDAAEWLITRSANISWVARAAAQGGHFDFVEKLLQQDASFYFATQGAAQGGHFDFAKKLEKKATDGTDINTIIFGAALGGHIQDTLQLLQEKGADIHEAAYGAGGGGHIELVQQLLQQGADINLVANAIATARHLDTEQQQLQILSSFSSDPIRNGFVNALSKLETAFIWIKPDTIKRADRIAKLRHHFGYPYSLSLLSTQACTLQNSDNTSSTKINSGALVMLAVLACFQSPYPLLKDENSNEIQTVLSAEIWHSIFEFVFECELSPNDFNQLGFLTGRLILLNQVSEYPSTDALRDAILQKNNVKELCEFVATKKDSDDNSAASTSLPPLQTIFKGWHERLKPDADDTESSSASATPG